VLVLVGRVEERLQPDADAEERLARRDVRDDGLRVPRVVELREAVAEAADAGQDQDLGWINVLWAGDGLMKRTSASATSLGVLIHFTDQPSVSIALTRERTLPAT
jgi:hypothetical protein